MDSSIWCSSGPELTILATTISIYISEMYDSTNLNTIANFVEAIGENLQLIAAQKNRCENSIQNDGATINNLFGNTQNN